MLSQNSPNLKMVESEIAVIKVNNTSQSRGESDWQPSEILNQKLQKELISRVVHVIFYYLADSLNFLVELLATRMETMLSTSS